VSVRVYHEKHKLNTNDLLVHAGAPVIAPASASATCRHKRPYSAEVRKFSSRGYAAGIGISAKTRPGRGVSTTIRCERETDSNTEWVTKITVLRTDCHTARRSLLSLNRVISSSAANGSSISRSCGSITSARAIDTRIFMPPDSSRG